MTTRPVKFCGDAAARAPARANGPEALNHKNQHKVPRSNHSTSNRGRQRAFLMTEVVIAMAILAIAVFPVGYAVWHEQQLSRACYFRAVAMEIVDGEIEVLAARGAPVPEEGSHTYSVHAEAARNLPPGHFVLVRTGKRLRLEWHPEKRDRGGPVVREVMLP